MSAQQYRSPILHVEASRPPAGATLTCRGEIDVSSIGCLEKALDAWAEAEVPELTVDLCETSYVDTTAVEALLRAHFRMLRAGGPLKVLVGPRSARVFRLLRMDRILNLSSGCAPGGEGCVLARRRVSRGRYQADCAGLASGSKRVAA